MNEASAARLDLARVIASTYAADPAVTAVLVGGSVARGYADSWSDLEISVFWTSAPSAEARAALTPTQATGRRAFPNAAATGAAEEDYEVDGIKVDVGHLAVAAAENILSDVIERGDPTLAKQVFTASVRNGIPLHGAALLAEWRTRTNSYPDALARATVTEHLVFGPHWWLVMLAERDDLPLLYGLLSRVERTVLLVLLGLNRVFPPSADLKWADHTAETLAIAPPELGGRLKHVFRAEPREGVEEAIRLIEETIALVEAHLPGVSITSVRARVGAPRTGRSPPARGGVPPLPRLFARLRARSNRVR